MLLLLCMHVFFPSPARSFAAGASSCTICSPGSYSDKSGARFDASMVRLYDCGFRVGMWRQDNVQCLLCSSYCIDMTG
jgi:hypothetical protein